MATEPPSAAEPGRPGAAFGVRLRALREAAGLTQGELASRAGLTTHAVSALERGVRTRPYPHTVRSLSAALGLGPDERARLLGSVPRRGSGGRSGDGEPSGAVLAVASASGAPVPAAAVPGVREGGVREPGATVAAALPPGGATSPAGPAPGAHLPVPATPLLGREREVATIAELVLRPAVRLVTLTGTGGVGKTRLAVAVAAEVAGAFPGGAAFVALAAVPDPALVLPEVARALGVGTVDGPDAYSALVGHLRERQLLLVLDNLEHLLAAAPDVARLLAESPGLTVLASSRAALRVRGELEHPVQPLVLPSGDDPDCVAASPAGALFLDRARAVDPGFTLGPGNAGPVADICTRLAGIPLALELAAARLRVLGPATLLARLDDVMSRAGAADLPPRQRTLQAALDWSYALLDEPQRWLFRLLGVFGGGFTLETAEEVAARAGRPEADVLGLLEGLVGHSLVVAVRDAAGVGRYALLEPIAQYARSRLGTGHEYRVAVAAHAATFLAFAERAAPEYQQGDQVAWLTRVEAEDANLLLAIERSLAAGDAESAARLGWALWLYWWLRGRLLLGRRLMEEALRHDLGARVRVRAQLTAGTMAFGQGDFAACGAHWEASLRTARAEGDVEGQAHAQAGLGLLLLTRGDLEAAEEQFRLALPLAEQAGPRGEGVAALTQVWLGTVRLQGGDARAARPLLDAGVRSARARGDRLTTYIGLYNLSRAALVLGDAALARAHLQEGVALSRETRDLANLAYFLDSLAVVEGALAEPYRVGMLLGAAEGLRETVAADAYSHYKPEAALREQAAERARAALGDDAYADAVAEGRRLDPEEAVALALAPAADGATVRAAAGT